MKSDLIWLRLYSEARTDAKLESLTDAQHRVWFRLLCYAGEQSVRGVIPATNRRKLAVEVARGDLALLDETLTVLAELEILAVTDEECTFQHWAARQYDKPSDAPDQVRARVAAHRARQRETEHTPQNVTPLNGRVTEGVCNADVTPSNALDTDTDQDPELRERDLPPAPARTREEAPPPDPEWEDLASRRATMATSAKNAPPPAPLPWDKTTGTARALPADFPRAPTPEMVAWVAANAPGVGDVAAQHRLFLTHYEGETDRDWGKRWRLWMQRPYATASGGNGRASPTPARAVNYLPINDLRGTN